MHLIMEENSQATSPSWLSQLNGLTKNTVTTDLPNSITEMEVLVLAQHLQEERKVDPLHYESITYALPNTFLRQEFLDTMPLPHRSGTTFYTQGDLLEHHEGPGLADSESTKINLQ